MTLPRPAFALFALLSALFFVPALFFVAADAAARTVLTEYSVTISGFPIGKARIEAELDGGRYSIGFAGRSTGLARLFSDAETTAAASGSIRAERLAPAEYEHVWTEDHENETVAIRFGAGAPAEIRLNPPRRRPERYVPLTEENMAGALDPVSAFLWPAGNGVDAELCARTIPLFDGKRRFDLAFSFSRFETFATRDRTYSGPAVVCSFRYRQIAGHRIGRTSGDSIQDSEGMEVWVVSAGDGVGLPVRIQFNTRIGRLLLQATTVQAK